MSSHRTHWEESCHREFGQNHSFATMWLLIIGVSVYDGFWVLANRPFINALERNAIGQLLLHWDAGDVWLLLTVKILGTLCTASVLLILYWTWPKLGWVACAATAAFQLALLLFLNLS